MQSQPRKQDDVRTGSSVQVRAIDLRGTEFRPSKTGTILLQNDAMDVASFRVPRGERRPLHSARGEAVIYCVEGNALLHTNDATYDLTPGVLVCLTAKEPHHLEGVADATLLTVNSRPSHPQVGVRHEPAVETESADRAQKPAAAEKDIVQEAAEESFPASDPPSWTSGVEDTPSTQSSSSAPVHSLAELQRRQDAASETRN